MGVNGGIFIDKKGKGVKITVVFPTKILRIFIRQPLLQCLNQLDHFQKGTINPFGCECSDNFPCTGVLDLYVFLKILEGGLVHE